MDDTALDPVPLRPELQQWATTLAEHIESGQVSGAELVEVLAQCRRASRDLAGLSDWLLVAARKNGATLPPLAAAWSSSGNSKLVHGPDQRLKKLADLVGEADAVLSRFLALPTDSSNAASDGSAPAQHRPGESV